MQILCISDIHGNKEKLNKLFKQKELFPGIDIIIIAGDITHFGDYVQAKSILQPVLESGYRILAVPGNCDKKGVSDYLNEQGINLHGKGIIFDSIGIMGLGGSNFSPHNTPNEYSEEQISHILEQGFREITNSPQKVLISHPPPKDTPLDRINSGLHVGSQAVRKFIIEKAINFCLCGHIHESAGRCRLGNADCINNGAFREGKYNILEMDIDGFKIIRSE